MKRGTSILISAALAAAATLTSAPAGAEEVHGKVVDGRPAAASAYPAQVALLAPTEPDPGAGQICGGTLIHSEWVLTAAHCVQPGFGLPYPDVLLGTNNLDGSGLRLATREQWIHPSFDVNSGANDIAVLRLASPAPQPTAALVYEGMESLEVAGTPAVVTGWGFADAYHSELYIELLEGDLPIISDDECVAEFTRQRIVIGNMTGIVCAGNGRMEGPPAISSCNGDSGGPLWATGPDGIRRQVGIVSGGSGPDCGFSPTIFTSVEAYIPFIEQTTGLQLASFGDIPGSSHEQNVERIALAGLAGGVGGGLYAPSAPVTRGQMATFLVRALRLAPATTPAPFSDTAGHRHEADIAAVAAAGLAGGFADGTYKPDQPVARDQMATFLARARGLTAIDAGPFADIAGNAHAGNINAVAAAGIAGGVGNGLYAPFDSVSRGQMATFLARAFLGA